MIRICGREIDETDPTYVAACRELDAMLPESPPITQIISVSPSQSTSPFRFAEQQGWRYDACACVLRHQDGDLLTREEFEDMDRVELASRLAKSPEYTG
jgi:hypothetical protein